jgi:DNA polymerase II
MRRTVAGWLFDLYASERGIALWIIDREGEKHFCHVPFTPCFFLDLHENDARRVPVLCRKAPAHITARRTSRIEFYSGKEIPVVQVDVHSTLRFKRVVSFFQSYFPHFAFYNSDIMMEQLFLYGTGLFPLAFGEYEIRDDELIRWDIDDRKEAMEYELPPLNIMLLRNANDFVPPKYQRNLNLEVSYDDRTYSLEHDHPAALLESLNWHLYHFDPDILLTEYGDSILLPKLTQTAKKLKIPLLLNREPKQDYLTTGESSFFQYGKVVHKDGAFELYGRWHVDACNSMTISEANLDGLFEMARLTQMPGQKQARASIGTSMSSLQLSWAYKNNILIPAKKREPEAFKSGYTLILADRGGLIYNPPPGYHERVAELDFASMYPSIMVNRNVSPETVNCRCCSNAGVPELGYTICEKRSGINPATLKSVIEKRSYYKRKKKEYRGKDELLYRKYHGRQNALKWMLVSCFGYLGYKNARFGRIEAHESVNAFSREILLEAKTIAEEAGFTLVHGIIDCLWLKKEGATEEDYEALCRAIQASTGIEISLEGIYDWILFPASKQHPTITTATRYTGMYRHGEMKMRGIETRRRDTPAFVKEVQGKLLEEMSKAGSVDEIRSMLPQLLETARTYLTVLRSGKANPMELVMRRHLTKEPDEYLNNGVSSVVSRMIENMGVHLAAGEMIEYILIDQSGKKAPEKAKPVALYAFEDAYDIEKYTEFVLKALETLFSPFGYDYDRLAALFGTGKVGRFPKAAVKPVQRVLELG